ncbi:lipase [Tritrichomonas foetus]|uniref:sn-1-specific diacylglycerol lipase n=1 Tax=Tritrichomonas foetus TaxID=1144522 RepID=A0A1J4JP24_9EUKA|nr:lipase [Tritrichomonas foetus]|eukprot:OHS99269.1 lipase [Tritrichomonas foetus]
MVLPRKLPSFPGFTLELIRFACMCANMSYYKMIDFPDDNIIQAFEDNTYCRPCYYVLYHNNSYYIVIRGTSSPKDIQTDANILETRFTVKDEEIYIKDGFFYSARFIYMMTRDLLLEKARGKPIYIIGHSMGGSVATVLNILFSRYKETESLDVYTVAIAPAPSVSKIPHDNWKKIISIVYEGDPVPKMYVMNVVKSNISRLWIDSLIGTVSSKVKILHGVFTGKYDYHALHKPNSVSVVEELTGYIFYIHEKTNKTRFRDFFLTPKDMINQGVYNFNFFKRHSNDNYCEELNHVTEF